MLRVAREDYPADADGRQWMTRDAVIRWLYNEKVLGRPVPLLWPPAVSVSVRWDCEDPPTTDETEAAARWLRREGLLDEPSPIGPVRRPIITPSGTIAAVTPGGVREHVMRSDDDPAA